MGPNLKISVELGKLLPDPFIYQRLVGQLIYLTNTRMDLTFVIGVVRHVLVLECSISLESSRASHILQMLIMRVLRVIDAILLASVLFVVVISYPRKVRTK